MASSSLAFSWRISRSFSSSSRSYSFRRRSIAAPDSSSRIRSLSALFSYCSCVAYSKLTFIKTPVLSFLFYISQNGIQNLFLFLTDLFQQITFPCHFFSLFQKFTVLFL